jgi:hypothetical protein
MLSDLDHHAAVRRRARFRCRRLGGSNHRPREAHLGAIGSERNARRHVISNERKRHDAPLSTTSRARSPNSPLRSGAPRRRTSVSATGLDDLQTINLSTALTIIVHKDGYRPIDLTQQGGPHRRHGGRCTSTFRRHPCRRCRASCHGCSPKPSPSQYLRFCSRPLRERERACADDRRRRSDISWKS